MRQTNWSDQLENLFNAIGLSGKEAKVYRVLIDGGELPVGEIISISHLKRGITYAILYNLEKDGLVTQFKKGSKTYFRPESPQKLFELLEGKRLQVEYLSKNFSQVLPKLISQFKLAVGKPTVRYFEGEEGIKEVFEDIYAPKKDIVYGCVDLEQADQAFPAYIQDTLIPKRIKNKVVAYSFIGQSEVSKLLVRQDKKQLRKSVLLDKFKYPLPAEIDVYEDKIALLSFTKGDFIGVIIQKADLAESLRSIFKLAFEKKQ